MKDFLEPNFTTIEKIILPFQRVYWFFERLYYEIKYKIQRLIIGYSTRDTWAVSDFIVEKTRLLIKKFVEDNIDESTCDERKEVLRKIERAFDLFYKHEIKGEVDDIILNHLDIYKKEVEEMQEGFELLGKNFMTLWN